MSGANNVVEPVQPRASLKRRFQIGLVSVLEPVARWLLRNRMGLKVKGLERIDFSKPTVLMPNHVSLLDGLVLSMVLPPDVHFVVNTERAQQYAPLLGGRNIIAVDPMNPHSLRKMLRVVRSGMPLVIFPEGRITRTGGLMKVYNGISFLAMRTGANVHPVAINGLERSTFSYLGKKNRTVLFPAVNVEVGEAISFQERPDLSSKEQKRFASQQVLQGLQKQLASSRLKEGVNLFNELIDAADRYGKKTVIAEDVGTKASYQTLIQGATAMSLKFAPLLEGQDNVGILLPTSVGHVVTFFALARLGKTAAILNFSVGSQTLLDCVANTELQTVLTSRQFIEKGDLHHLVEALEGVVKVIYLEDIKASIGPADKIRTLLTLQTQRRSTAAQNRVILFTSGSESKPKGVVLTHDNLYANVQQAVALIDITAQDKLMNVLPMFHSFGLTAGTLLPLLRGVPVFLYPSPLHYKIVPELVYDSCATIMFGTSTFLAGYARNAHHYDFFSLRYVFAGAEKVKDDVRQLWLTKFGIRVFEGYGATETAPILSLNTPLFHRPGTVGQLLPGIEYQVKPVDGIDKGGELIVKGANVMAGYYIHGKGFVPADEWYCTGDLVTVDADGFLTIHSRLKRFAKIGGEMVSLNLVEELAGRCFAHTDFASVSINHPRKGERVILFTTDASASLERLRAFIGEQGYPPLMAPASIQVVPSIPVLGSGKTDYVTLTSTAQMRYPAD